MTTCIYLYDVKKAKGFMYDSLQRIYVEIDKQKLEKMNSSLCQTVHKDIRPIINLLPQGNIPIEHGRMIESNTIRDRTDQDYVTYELPWTDIQEVNLGTTFGTNQVNPDISSWFQSICRSPLDQSMFHNVIRGYLLGYGDSYILLSGPGTEFLFEQLLKLDPIVKRGHSKLYTQLYMTTKYVQEVSTALIVVVDIGDCTLRIPNLKSYKDKFPVQFRGLVQTKMNNALYLHKPKVEQVNFTPTEMLQWILYG